MAKTVEVAQTLDDVIAAYESKYAKEGQKLVQMGSDFDNPKRLWPGSLELAWAMGGGFPVGRMGRLWGTKSTGKSKTAYSLIADAQRQGMTCTFINAEKQFEPLLALKQGVDLDSLYVVSGNIIEQIGEFIHASLDKNDLFVLDSTSICMSAAARESGMDSERPMMDAKAWANIMKFIFDEFDHTRNTIILIDQARVGKTAMGGFGGEQASGGFALDHDSSMTAKFTASTWLFQENGFLSDAESAKGKSSKETVSGQMEPAGRVTKVRIEKSRVGAPFRTATMWFDFATGDYEHEYEYFKWGKHLGLIEGDGWYQINGGQKIQGKPKTKAWIRDNPDFQEEVKKKVLEIA
jgi:recombination protein RecA